MEDKEINYTNYPSGLWTTELKPQWTNKNENLKTLNNEIIKVCSIEDTYDYVVDRPNGR